MFLFSQFLVEISMMSDVLIELFIFNSGSVFLKCLDQDSIIIEHFAVEAEQIMILVGSDFELVSQKVDLLDLLLLDLVRLIDNGSQAQVILKEGINEERI